MRTLTLATLILSLATIAQAETAPQFSAFVSGQNLYVTVLGDSCNNHSGSLRVSDTCANDRLTRNLSPLCDAQVQIMTTRMACHDTEPVARVVAIDLTKNNVADEAVLLSLTYGGQTIDVKVK